MQSTRVVLATLVGVAAAILIGWLGWGYRGAMDRAYGVAPRTVVTETTTVRTTAQQEVRQTAPAALPTSASPNSDITAALGALGAKIDQNFQRLEQGQNALSQRVSVLEAQRIAPPQPQPTPPCTGSPAASPEGEWTPARVPTIR